MASNFLSFNPGGMTSAISAVAARSAIWDKASDASADVLTAAGKASTASSAVAARSVTWDKASDASALAATNAGKVSTCSSAVAARSAAWDAAGTKASDASSAVAARSAIWDKASDASAALLTAIFSVPGDSSFRVKEIVVTEGSLIRYKFSSTAEGD